MAIRPFSSVPQATATYTLTLPTVNANTTAEVGVLGKTVLGAGGRIDAEHHVSVEPAAALPTGIVFSGAYFNSTDSKIYFRFGNLTGSNYTSAETVAFSVVVL